MRTKKTVRALLLLPLLAALAVGCLPPPIDIDVKPAEPRMTVASQVFGTQGLIVALSRSYSPLDTAGDNDSLTNDFLNQILVSNALVTVSYGSSTDTLTMISPGLYLNLLTPLNDYTTYTIRAKDPVSGLEVWAATTLMPRVNFDTVFPYIQRQQDTLVFMRYQLRDNTSEENYYVVNFIKKVQGDSTFDINSVFSAGSNQLLTEFDLLDDQAFENGFLDTETLLTQAGQHDTVAAVVSSITKGYYEFLSAYKRSGSIFNQLTGEPINYPTNVNGGHGYFTLHRQDVHVFDLNDY